MPSRLQDFVSDSTATGAPLRIPAAGKKLPKSNYIALALVLKNLLPDIGSGTTFTPPGAGTQTAVALTVQNIATILQALAYNGQAFVFGNGAINGKRGKPKEDMEKTIFGSRRSARPTGEIEEVYSFAFKNFYQNRQFFNQLRSNFAEYDMYVFTDRSVETVRFDQAEPIFMNIGDETAGSNTEEITGMFDVLCGLDGQVDPDFAPGSIFEAAMAISKFKYTFGTVTATGLTAVLSNTQFNMTASTGGTIARAVAESVVANSVTYQIFTDDGSAVPAGITIASTTGTITVASSLAVGTYKLKVIAQNAVGIMGEWGFKIVCS